MEQELAQPRIHAVPPAGTPGAEAASSPKVVPFDFRKPGQNSRLADARHLHAQAEISCISKWSAACQPTCDRVLPRRCWRLTISPTPCFYAACLPQHASYP